MKYLLCQVSCIWEFMCTRLRSRSIEIYNSSKTNSYENYVYLAFAIFFHGEDKSGTFKICEPQTGEQSI